MHAELDRLFDDPIKLFGGDPSLNQRYRQRRFTLHDVRRSYLGENTRAVDRQVRSKFAALAVEQRDRITVAQPQHAQRMMRDTRRQFDLCGGCKRRVDKKTRRSHVLRNCRYD